MVFKIRIDNSDGTAKLVQFEQKLNNVAKAGKGMGNTLQNAFAMSVVYRALGAFNSALQSSVTEIMNFEKALHGLKGLADGTDAWTTSMSRNFRELSLGVEHSSASIAEAMIALKRMGDEDHEALARLPHLMNAVTATGMSMETVMTSTAATMKSFGIEAQYTEAIIDRMVSVADNSPQTFEDLQEAMKNVQPAAAALGVSLEETLALIGTISETGLKGGRAGIALRNMFLNMQKPTGAVAEALKTLNTEGMNFQEVLAAVAAETSVVELMDTLDKRSISSGEHIAVAGQAYQDLLDVMEGSGGATARRAEEMRESWSLSWGEITKNISELGVNFAMAYDQLSDSSLLDTINTSLVEMNQALIDNPELISDVVKAIDLAGDVVGILVTNIDKLVLAFVAYKVALVGTAIATAGNTTLFGALSASEIVSTGTTYALGTSITALGTKMKAFALANPMLIAITAITTAIGIAMIEVDKWSTRISQTVKLQGEATEESLSKRLNARREFVSQFASLRDEFESGGISARAFENEFTSLRGSMINSFRDQGLDAKAEAFKLFDLDAFASADERIAVIDDFFNSTITLAEHLRLVRAKVADTYTPTPSDMPDPESSESGSGSGRGSNNQSALLYMMAQELPVQMQRFLVDSFHSSIIPEFETLFSFAADEYGEKYEEALKKFEDYSDTQRLSAFDNFSSAIASSMSNLDFRYFADSVESYRSTTTELLNSMNDPENRLALIRKSEENIARMEASMWGNMPDVADSLLSQGTRVSSPLFNVTSYRDVQRAGEAEKHDLLSAYSDGSLGKGAMDRVKEIDQFMKETRSQFIQSTVDMSMSSVSNALSAFDSIAQGQYDRMVQLHEKELALLNNKEERAIALAGSSERRRLLIAQQFDKRRQAMVKAQEDEQAEALRKRQGLQIAQAIMDTASSIMQIWSDPSAGSSIAKGILSATVAGLGATQIATISNQKFAFGTGNRRVSGFAGSTSDLVPAYLSPDEMVLTGDSVDQAGGPDAVDQLIRGASSQLGGRGGINLYLTLGTVVGSVPDDVAIEISDKINELTALNAI